MGSGGEKEKELSARAARLFGGEGAGVWRECAGLKCAAEAVEVVERGRGGGERWRGGREGGGGGGGRGGERGGDGEKRGREGGERERERARERESERAREIEIDR